MASTVVMDRFPLPLEPEKAILNTCSGQADAQSRAPTIGQIPRNPLQRTITRRGDRVWKEEADPNASDESLETREV
jgi:hypothetical protein